MHLPMQFLLASALLTGLGVFARGPPPLQQRMDPTSDKLEQCGCTKIANAIMKCQGIDWKNTMSDKETRDCVCISNEDRENAWYGYIHNCRACLSPGSYDINDFFDNFSRTFSQLLVSCTNAGGGVTADGSSICASNYYFEGCVSLKPNGNSWASYEVFGRNGDEVQKGNGTMAFNLVNPNGDDSDSDSDDEGTSTTLTLTTSTSSVTAPTTDGQDVTTTQPEESATQDPTTSTETTPAGTTAPAGSSAMSGAVVPGFMMAVALGVGSMLI
ncbi:hypothetical protein QC761_704020 [Podospora bellae-mahoneyi]|uniref:Uncharacterized protein n=1 Tax=Podospora bellae-mahoneyi TaxID=2093777 RepID=A0ABR0F5J7_9PEZI|nr:hypothetical protein QC761_704020 [Podospora bellae-mahoneyi]